VADSPNRKTAKPLTTFRGVEPVIHTVVSSWFPQLTDASLGVILSLFAAAVAIAILRYHLYDIDLVINRTIVYGLLTALLGTVYAGAVLVVLR
jgi:hypothetical protein